MSDTTPVLLTRDELWLLQHCIRHELPGQETWTYPPANGDLNDQIAEAILFCETGSVSETALRLSWGDLLALDYTVPADAKDTEGRPIGRIILLKTFAARAQLKRGIPGPDVPEPEALGSADVVTRLRGGL